MELVVDANVIFSALIKASHTRHLLLTRNVALYAPEFVLSEVNNHLDELSEKTNLSKIALSKLLLELISAAEIKIIAGNEFKNELREAKKITPDPDDVQYFALAMKLKCSIWSNDKKLRQQNAVRIYSTEELTREQQ